MTPSKYTQNSNNIAIVWKTSNFFIKWTVVNLILLKNFQIFKMFLISEGVCISTMCYFRKTCQDLKFSRGELSKSYRKSNKVVCSQQTKPQFLTKLWFLIDKRKLTISPVIDSCQNFNFLYLLELRCKFTNQWR